MSEQIIETSYSKYLINTKHLLGQGAFGKVYKGQDINGNTIAIKAIEKSDKFTSINVTLGTKGSSIGKELAAIQSLNTCDYVVKVLDYVEVGKTVYIFLEYCEGDLEHYIKKNGPLSRNKALGIFTDIGRGLLEIHKRGIMHRDIKPGNILLSKGLYKINDFGLAIRAARDNSAWGTPGFWAPEQQAGKMYTNKVDIHAMGMLFGCLLTGKTSPGAIRADDFSDVDEDLVDFFKSMINPNTAERIDCETLLKTCLKLSRSRGFTEPVISPSKSLFETLKTLEKPKVIEKTVFPKSSVVSASDDGDDDSFSTLDRTRSISKFEIPKFGFETGFPLSAPKERKEAYVSTPKPRYHTPKHERHDVKHKKEVHPGDVTPKIGFVTVTVSLDKKILSGPKPGYNPKHHGYHGKHK